MYQIVIDGQSLFLGPDFEIDFEMRHPLLMNSEITGSYSIPFEIPYCELNERILQQASCVEIRNRTKSFDAQLTVRGAIQNVGKLLLNETYREASTGSYKCDFVIDGFQLNIIDLDVNELPGWDTYSFSDYPSLMDKVKAASEVFWPESEFGFPMIYWPEFYGDSNSDFFGFVNAYDADSNEYPSNAMGSNQYTLVPMPYWKYLFSVVFKGLDIQGTFWEDTEANQLMCLSNYAIDLKEKLYYTRANQTADTALAAPNTVVLLDDDSTLPNEDNSSVFDTSTGEYTITTEGPHRFVAQLKARYTGTFGASYRIKIRYQTPVGALGLKTEFVTHNTWYEFTLENEKYLLGWYEFLPAHIGGKVKIICEFEYLNAGIWYPDAGETRVYSAEFINIDAQEWNKFSLSFDKSKIVPKMPVSEFLVEARNSLGINISINSAKGVVFIDWIGELMGGKEKDYTSKVVDQRTIFHRYNSGFIAKYDMPEQSEFSFDASGFTIGNPVIRYDQLELTGVVFNTVQLVLNENAWYVYGKNSLTNDLEWQFLAFNINDVTYGDGSEEFRIKFSPVLMKLVDGFGTEQYLVPWIDGSGSSEYFSVGINECPKKTMIYRGFQLLKTGTKLYPFATSMQYLPDGSIDAVFPYNLNLDDFTSGIVSKGAHDFRTIRATGEMIRFLLILNENDISDVDYRERIRIGYTRYIILKMNAKYNNAGLNQITEADLLKLE